MRYNIVAHQTRSSGRELVYNAFRTPMRDDEYFAIKERAAAQLLKIPHVTAVGLGGRETGGRSTGEIAIKVFVDRKKPAGDVPAEERIPAAFEGVPTDVLEMGSVRRTELVPGVTHPAGMLPDINPYDPLRGGVSLSVEGKVGIGTIGCILRDKADGSAIYALTNHHVVAVKDKLSRSRRVSHPSLFEDLVFKFTPGSAIGIVAEGVDEPIVDAAVVRLDPGTRWLPCVTQAGFLRGTHDLTLDDVRNNDYNVRKRGAATKYTGGVIACIEGECLELSSETQIGKFVRKKNIFIRPHPVPSDPVPQAFFSYEGDSGSVLVNDNNEVVGLLYGSDKGTNPTTGGYGMALPIGSVLRRLKEVRKLDLEVAIATNPDPTETNEVQQVPFPAGAPTLTPVEQIAAGDHGHYRPLAGGLQIMAHPMLGDANSATLGCIVTEIGNEGAAYVLTSYGAVSAEGSIPPTGDTDVGQPNNHGSQSGCCSNTVGEFSKGGPAHGTPTAALVRLDDDQKWLAEIVHVGLIAGDAVASVDDHVVKHGAGSGLTGGVVVDVSPLPAGVLADAMLIRPHPNPKKPTEDLHFSRFMDRGAAIINRGNKVVGVLYDEVDIPEGGRHVFHGVATPIGVILDALRAQAGVDVQVASATEMDHVRGASARVAIARDAATGPTIPVRVPRRARFAAPLVLPDELSWSPRGQVFAAAWREHQSEIRDLIDHNRKVATVWHRSGGPALLQAVVRAFHSTAVTMPHSINGLPVAACLDRLAEALSRHGSSALRADLARVHSLLPPLGGLTYVEMLAAVNRG